MEYLFSYKSLVDKHLRKFLLKKEKDLADVNAWGSDLLHRLLPFVSAGKSIRGSLVLYSFSLFKKTISLKALDSAAALELFQTGLLIHDDIMDKDTIRRGMPSFHVQYKSEALAMCAGDFCFFLAHELVASSVQKYVSHELSHVAIAQMQDIAGAHTQEEILSLYRYKTARYSFSVPMVIGAQLANVDKRTQSKLKALGEDIGILFQIRDDELDGNKGLTIITKQKLHQSANSKIMALSIAIERKRELSALVDFCEKRTL